MRTLDEDLFDALWPDFCAAAVLEEFAVLALGCDAGGGVELLHGGAMGHLRMTKGEGAGEKERGGYIGRRESRSEMEQIWQERATALEIGNIAGRSRLGQGQGIRADAADSIQHAK